MPSGQLPASYPASYHATAGSPTLSPTAQALVTLIKVTKDMAAEPAADPAAPRAVRGAGVLVALQGVAAGVVAVALLVVAVGGSLSLTLTLATAGSFAAISAALVAVGVNLVRGRYGARSPAVVAQILLIGVSWYAAGPSGQPASGIPAALYCLTVLVLLFCPSAGRWAAGQDSMSA